MHAACVRGRLLVDENTKVGGDGQAVRAQLANLALLIAGGDRRSVNSKLNLIVLNWSNYTLQCPSRAARAPKIRSKK
jgi:hypothetical protein